MKLLSGIRSAQTAAAALSDLVSSRRMNAADPTRGFYESSFDLRSGLEVSERPLSELPEELSREFVPLRDRRQRA
jgi:hypothetical protein